MGQPPYELDIPRRQIVLNTIREVSEYRGWELHAAHVRTTHVHVVVTSTESPEGVMNDFKGYASRRLNEAGFENAEGKRWTRHGSTPYLWKPRDVEAAVHYVVHEQGEPMAVFDRSGEDRSLNTPRFARSRNSAQPRFPSRFPSPCQRPLRPVP